MKRILEQGKVSFPQAMSDFFKGYADFRGRSTRRGYWFAMLGILVIYVILTIITGISSSNREYYESPINGFMLFIIVLFTLAIIIPSIALSVRRLRDTGLKSKTILVLFIVYYALSYTWGMNLYSTVLNSVTSMASAYSSYSDVTTPLTTLNLSGSPLLTFFTMLLSIFITISAFLPSDMFATTSKNSVLTSIFSEK
ncbi:MULTISPECIES: DUF805 domain-containing protein [Enterococcus]|uniref:DUF805 domain-containing protein n=1 Tax=Enterococcus alishanensis TaxID=1303817 RepID=A0ABS6TGJ8_9ENTE|nr:DUF805 domain-containing protein [Enterococcus alishanensis]MBV7392089.1 DUF805 domain-containing protein [Enterococcus alishanensis]